MSSVDWSALAPVAVPIVVAIALKLWLDLRLAPILVKYLYWLPLRNYFRERPPKLSGTWEHLWSSGGSLTFEQDVDRHGQSEVKQLGSYIYAELYSQGVKYGFFGQSKHGYLVGDWFDIEDPMGYFGVFQLEIVNSSRMTGRWMGHSKTDRSIRGDVFAWTRLSK